MASTETAEFGKRIAVARRELGLTQRELADRIGVMLGTLEAFETGLADPSPHLDRIAEATGKEPLWFLSGDSAEQIADRLQRQATELARREAALRREENELARARKEAEQRLSELNAVERHDPAPPAVLPTDHLGAREAELERAAADLAEREAAFKVVERQFKEHRLREAQERRRGEQQEPRREQEESVAEREHELDGGRAELAAWTQTADRVTAELRGCLVTLERLKDEVSADRARAVSERADLEIRALDIARIEEQQQERSAQLEARAAALDERALKLEDLEESSNALEQELARREAELEGQRSIEARLEERERAITRAEAELSERAKALERRSRLEAEQDGLDHARAAAEQKLVDLQTQVREAVASLEAELAEREADSEDVPPANSVAGGKKTAGGILRLRKPRE